MLLGLGGGLKRLQFIIGFITTRFKALVDIAAIHIFVDIFSKAIPSIFPRDYFTNMIKFIVTPYRIIMIFLEDFLLQ